MRMIRPIVPVLTLLVLASLPPARAQTDWEAVKTFQIGGEGGWESVECLKARRFLCADSPFEAEDLKFVCEFADLPHDRIISWARRQYPAAA